MWFSGGLRKLGRFTTTIENEMSSNSSLFVRYMSRERAVNVRKINPKVPIQEAYSISNSLYDLFKLHGPLSVPHTWLRAQEAGVSGINSKTHMKLLLKWMRGRKMLKLICNQVGTSKKFFHIVYPEDAQEDQDRREAAADLSVTKTANKSKSKSKKLGSKKKNK